MPTITSKQLSIRKKAAHLLPEAAKHIEAGDHLAAAHHAYVAHAHHLHLEEHANHAARLYHEQHGDK